MPPLPTDLRRDLENAIIDAREAAERGAEAALKVLVVDQHEAFSTMPAEQRLLRNTLRARGRVLGSGDQDKRFPPLVEEVAYEQWHRMLFARFLAENGLLMHPTGVPVTLQECAELAPEEGEPDEWMVAARYASAMLPGIFRTDDPSVQVRFAPNDRQALERILKGLPSQLFTADDALGWVYQFWQTKAKQEVNRSGRKIGGAELPAVTQLFTEDYMVRFLLEDSLGAWWAARHPESPLVNEWEYLRYRDDGTPAAGTFAGWPGRAAEITMMDPCCGSGHFLVVAFEMLRRMRMEEEGLSATEAGDRVLRDNLFGLELDARCTQLAAFALAFAAWKTGGYRELSLPNVACSGIAIGGQVEDWTHLAGDDVNLRLTLERLYYLFKDAPDLGSLINPADVPLRDRMFAKDYAEVAPLVRQALAKSGDDPAAAVFGAAAEGAARAGDLLARQYTLVATNVPYLGRGKQSDTLKDFCSRVYPSSKSDLATAFLERSAAFCLPSGTCALVTPQTWFFQATFKGLRRDFLTRWDWNALVTLGEEAWQAFGIRGPRAVLILITNARPRADAAFAHIDLSTTRMMAPIRAPEKARLLARSAVGKGNRLGTITTVRQSDQLLNPDSRITGTGRSELPLLAAYAASAEGTSTGDAERFVFMFWELPGFSNVWVPFQRSPDGDHAWSGARGALRWEGGSGTIANSKQARVQGQAAWGRCGVLINLMHNLNASLYTGQIYDKITAAIVPNDPEHLSAIWVFCRSLDYVRLVRQMNPAVQPGATTLVKVPFDLARWQEAAKQAGDLPKAFSADPTQWLFGGHPAGSNSPLQVALARLVRYCWPQQEVDTLDALADSDGIVCIPPVGGERPGGERLRELLARAFGSEWSLSLQERLLAEAGSPGRTLEQWLRDDFFAQHCRLFHNRPFIWQVWDGRRDGFSVLLNYHRLGHKDLQKVTYSYLGWWIDLQRKARDAGEAGADGRLEAALKLKAKLEAVLAGDPPYDIYVRWKPLEQQPIGWNPDPQDGVRLNIRPFIEAGVLRARVNVHWRKDPGKNPDGSDRVNDLHFTVAQKQEARRQAGL